MALLQRTLIAAATAAVLAGSLTLPAWAQTTPAAPTAPAAVQAPHKAQRAPMDHAAMHAKRMEKLKPLLQLTPAQEGAWSKYVEATRPAERKGPRMDREAWSKLTTPQRIELAQTHRKERAAAAEQRESATKAFYATLNPAQQKAFDAATPMHGHGMHPGGHRHHGGQPGPAPTGA